MSILKEKLDAYLKCYLDAHDNVKRIFDDVVSVYEFTEKKLNNIRNTERMKQVVLDQANESITQIEKEMKKSTTDFFNFLMDDKPRDERPQQVDPKKREMFQKVQQLAHAVKHTTNMEHKRRFFDMLILMQKGADLDALQPHLQALRRNAMDQFDVEHQAILKELIKEEEPLFLQMDSDQELPEDFELDKGKEEESELSESKLESDSDSVVGGGEMEEQVIAVDDEEYDDDFVVPDNSDISVYEGSEYDECFLGVKPELLQKTKKRPRRVSSRSNKGKIERLVMDDDEEEDNDDEEEDLDEEEDHVPSFSIHDVGECRQFFTALKECGALQRPALLLKCIKASVWFQRRYMEKLEMIRQNMGFQNNNAKSIALWNKMTETAFTQETTPRLSKSAVLDISPNNCRCCFCNLKRNCPFSLIVENITYPIGTKCFELAEAVINFYEEIRYSLTLSRDEKDTISVLDKAIGKVQDAHAGKQFKKRK